MRQCVQVESGVFTRMSRVSFLAGGVKNNVQSWTVGYNVRQNLAAEPSDQRVVAGQPVVDDEVVVDTMSTGQSIILLHFEDRVRSLF